MQKPKTNKRTANALRDAQLSGVNLLLWQKFGFGRILFARYYKAQKIICDNEWPILNQTLQRELPVTFRMHSYHPARNKFLRELGRLNVRSLPWMPDSTGFVIPDAPRTGSSRTPIGQWLVRAVHFGVAARQVLSTVSFCASAEVDSLESHRYLRAVMAFGNRKRRLCSRPCCLISHRDCPSSTCLQPCSLPLRWFARIVRTEANLINENLS